MRRARLPKRKSSSLSGVEDVKIFKLIAGLGNPGQEYAFTRHNMGWLAVDHLVARLGLGEPQSKFRGQFWKSRDILFLKPLTYMNLSGFAVHDAYDFYKLEPENILIIYDDLALPFGKLRLRAKGSAGGHNGLASIIGALNTLNIPRLRIGLGGNPEHIDMKDRVLGHLNSQERNALPEILDNIENAVKAWLELDIQKAMSAVN